MGIMPNHDLKRNVVQLLQRAQFRPQVVVRLYATVLFSKEFTIYIIISIDNLCNYEQFTTKK